MSALWKVLGFTLAGAMLAAGCVVTSDDDDDLDIGGFAGEGGDETGGTTSGGSGGTTGGTTSGGSGGSTGGSTSGGSSGEGGSAGAPVDDNPCLGGGIIASDPTQCCQPCVELYCGPQLDECAADSNCYVGDGTGEFELLQDCLKLKSASTDYDYLVALSECEQEHAKDPVTATFAGTTHGLIGCVRDNDCTVQCFYESTAAP